MDIPYLLPGTTEPAITITLPTVGSPKVLVDGVRVKGRRGGRFDIPLGDGTTTELRIKGQLTGFKAVADGVETPLETPINPFVVALTLLPFVLIVLGGLIGGLVAGVALFVNTWLVRRAIPMAAKVIGILGVTALAGVVWFGIAFAISPLATFETGTCVNGVGASQAQLTANSTKPVDCASAHDAEVVGTMEHPSDGDYPGESVLLEYAQATCVQAFDGYVGSKFETSSLEMAVKYPIDLTWRKGDRQIACIAYPLDGSQLTGSVKGSGL